MWPWEHLALGYLCYSAYIHVRYRQPPDGQATVVLAVATQIPDLVDKPLAWSFSLLPSGYSIDHSIFFGLPLAVTVVSVTHRLGVVRYSGAFVIGYATHLLADVLYPVAIGGGVNIDRVLWPLRSTGTHATAGFLARFSALVTEFTGYLGTPRGHYYLFAEGVFLSVALLLWRYDGAPGLAVPHTKHDHDGV